MGPEGQSRYRQIASDLRAKLAAGTYRVADALPSTAKLAAEYAASATVIQRALRELKFDGIVEGQPGKGVFVVRKPEPVEPSAEYRTLAARIDALERRVEEIDKSDSHASTVQQPGVAR